MRRPAQVTRKTLITMAAAGGALALGGGYAHADAGASGHAANSPGLLSGNNLQAPVNMPVNACGNTISVAGLLNPAFGNDCSNDSGHPHGGKPRPPRPEKPQHPDRPEEPCDEEQEPGNPGTGNPGTGNPGTPGTGQPGTGTPGTPGTGTPGTGTPATPGTPGTGTPGTGTGPGSGSVTPVTHPGTGTGTHGPTEGLAATGGGDVLTVGLPLAGGLLLAGTVLYRRARHAA